MGLFRNMGQWGEMGVGKRGFGISTCAAVTLFLAGVPVALSSSVEVQAFVKALATSLGVVLGWGTCQQLPHRTKEVSILVYLMMAVGAVCVAFAQQVGRTPAAAVALERLGCVLVNTSCGALYVIGMMLLLMWMISRAWFAMYVSLQVYFLGALFGTFIFLPAVSLVSLPVQVLMIVTILLVPGVSASLLHVFPSEEDELSETKCTV